MTRQAAELPAVLAGRRQWVLRARDVQIEARAATPGATDRSAGTVAGYAARFGVDSQVLTDFWTGDTFVEQIAPGAFRKTLKESDVRALVNHDPNLVLGRNKSGTLRMTEDDHGLAVEIDLPDTQIGRDTYESVRRGDMSQMSFAFEVVKDRVERDAAPDKPARITIVEARLYDVSVVTYPAYTQTSIEARALDDGAEVPAAARAAARIARALVRGEGPAARDVAELRDVLAATGVELREMAPEPVQDHSEALPIVEPTLSHSVADVDDYRARVLASALAARARLAGVV